MTVCIHPFGEAMEYQRLGIFQKLLRDQLYAVLHETTCTINGIVETEEVSGDLADQATVEIDQSFLLRMRERERRMIVKIRDALKRIEAKTYGICESCGEAISERRLIARPVATLCIHCKSLQEETEKRHGK